MTTPNIFSEPNDLGNEDINLDAVTLETLVGEGQKYANADALAKAYIHADNFGNTLKGENAELRAELKVLKDMLEANQNKPPVQTEPRNIDPPAAPLSEPHSEKRGEEKDMTTLIREELERTSKEKLFSDNVNSVSERLASHFGDPVNARNALAKKAKELGVGVDWLMDVAGKSPDAFYSTIGIDRRSFSTPSSGGTVNTSAFSSSGSKKDFKYYEELRKTNPNSYYSRAIQKEMFASRTSLGDSFYT